MQKKLMFDVEAILCLPIGSNIREQLFNKLGIVVSVMGVFGAPYLMSSPYLRKWLGRFWMENVDRKNLRLIESHDFALSFVLCRE